MALLVGQRRTLWQERNYTDDNASLLGWAQGSSEIHRGQCMLSQGWASGSSEIHRW